MSYSPSLYELRKDKDEMVIPPDEASGETAVRPSEGAPELIGYAAETAINAGVPLSPESAEEWAINGDVVPFPAPPEPGPDLAA